MDKKLPLDIAAKINSDSEYFEYNGKFYNVSYSNDNPNTVHGGPFDRGSADSYYGRAPVPHFWLNGTGLGTKVERDSMSKDQIDAYYAGYEYNEMLGDRKDWG